MSHLYNPLKSMPDCTPHRRHFITLVMKHMRERDMAWSDFNVAKSFGKDTYSHMRRLKGTVPIRPKHIHCLADIFKLAGAERDAFLLAAYLGTAPDELSNLLTRRVPMPAIGS